MVFKKRSQKTRLNDGDAETPDYEEVAKNRLRSIGERGGYDYADEERADVERRLRRMFYGAKVEGSKARPSEDEETGD